MLATQVQYWNMREASRHNVASEKQALRELDETARHNAASERISWENLRFQQSKLASDIEMARQQRELGWANYYETARSNKAREEENTRSNVHREMETQRSNMAKEAETSRNNKWNNWLSLGNTVVNAASTGAKIVLGLKKGF